MSSSTSVLLVRTPGGSITQYSTSSNFDDLGGLEYVFGTGDATALDTVVRDTPKRFDIARWLNPSATCRRRISAQSFTVIIHPIWLGWPTFQRVSTLGIPVRDFLHDFSGHEQSSRGR